MRAALERRYGIVVVGNEVLGLAIEESSIMQPLHPEISSPTNVRQLTAVTETNGHLLGIAIVHFGFALTGIVTTMLGAILPLLTSRWNLSDVQAGRLFTAQFLSAVTGSFIASRVLARWGTARAVGTGMLLIAVGVSATGMDKVALGVAGICIFGLGLGFALPATNLLAAEMVPEERVGALNILNFFWTIGAMTGPLLIGFAQRSIGFRSFAVLLCIPFVLISIFDFAALSCTNPTATASQKGKLAGHERIGFAVLTCAFLVLYVGVENGFSGWLSVLASRLHHAQLPTMAVIQSSFWGAILAGRLLAPVLVRTIPAIKLVFLGLAAAAVGIVVTVVSARLAEFEAGVLLCGLGLAALFPTAVAIFAEWYGTGSAGTVVLGLCGFGGAAIPLAVSFVGSYSGSLRAGFMVNFCCVMFAVLTFWRIQVLVRSQPKESRVA